MPKDVFLSYSNRNQAVAKAICATLESAGITCWIAPRDIRGGADWHEAIIEAIHQCRVMVLIFSADSNRSVQVIREVDRAVARSIPVIPFRIEDVPLSFGMEYLISVCQWIDAFPSPSEPQLARLVAAVQEQLRAPAAPSLSAESRAASRLLPPPAPESPPDSPSFVGRERELSDLASRLASDHLAIIAGMPGTGKTTLAAKHARGAAEAGQNVFWHTFHSSEGIETVVWRLAGYLASQGQSEIWHSLQRSQQSNAQPVPIKLLVDYLLQSIRGKGCQIYLDDFHCVQDDPRTAVLLDGLLVLVRDSELSLVIVSRQMPDFAEKDAVQQISGLDITAARQLLGQHGVVLPDSLEQDLYAHTEGNPELLTLAAESLISGRDPVALIGDLLQSDNVLRFLTTETDKGLTEDQRAVMSAVAVLLGHPGSREAIEHLQPVSNLRRILSFLTARYLLITTLEPKDKKYSEHSLVQEYYYDLLSRRERIELHRAAGEFYEVVERDFLRAARHFERAGEPDRALRLAAENVWQIINRGEVKSLRELLDRLSSARLASQDRIELHLALGHACTVLGDSETARSSYEAVLAEAALPLASPHALRLRAEAHRGIGALLKDDAPVEALTWLRRGLEELAQAADANDVRQQRAGLNAELGFALINTGAFGEAIDALQQGLTLLPPGAHPLRAACLINLGIAHAEQGDSPAAQAYYQEALTMAEELGDRWRVTSARHNTGVELEINGDWEAAVGEYQAALATADQLGSARHQATVISSLGILRMKRGEYAESEAHLTRGLAVAEAASLRAYQVGALASRADLYLRQERMDEAGALLAQAREMAEEIEGRDQLPEIFRLIALLQVTEGDARQALLTIERSLALAREMDIQPEVGEGLRVKGQALAALGDESAMTCFAESAAVLKDYDPYEAARTQATWGHALLAGAEAERGRALLREAKVEFERLGASRDAAAI